MKSIPISFITLNSIDKHLLHASQMHILTYTQVFMMWNRIQAYKGDVNIYGPLWTLTCICTMWTYFLIILYIFPLLFFSQKDFITPHIINNHNRLFPSPQHHVCLHLPILSYLLHILLLFVRTFSP